MSSTVRGEMIKAARKRKRLSAEKLGEMLNPPVTYAAIYAWEKGKNEPSVAYLVQLCKLLEADISDFIDVPENRKADESREIGEYLDQMSEKQRDAVLCVARAMVDF